MHLGQIHPKWFWSRKLGPSPDFSKQMVWTPVHFISTPNTINTCHIYTNWLLFIGFCVCFFFLWTGLGWFCLVVVLLANLLKKSPCPGQDHETDGNTPRTHKTSNLLINVMPQDHGDPQRMCFGWDMTINDGFSLVQCLINNQVVVNERTLLLNTCSQLIQKDTWFRLFEEVIPLLGPNEHQNNSLGSSAPVLQNSYIL